MDRCAFGNYPKKPPKIKVLKTNGVIQAPSQLTWQAAYEMTRPLPWDQGAWAAAFHAPAQTVVFKPKQLPKPGQANPKSEEVWKRSRGNAETSPTRRPTFLQKHLSSGRHPTTRTHAHTHTHTQVHEHTRVESKDNHEARTVRRRLWTWAFVEGRPLFVWRLQSSKKFRV